MKLPLHLLIIIFICLTLLIPGSVYAKPDRDNCDKPGNPWKKEDCPDSPTMTPTHSPTPTPTPTSTLPPTSTSVLTATSTTTPTPTILTPTYSYLPPQDMTEPDVLGASTSEGKSTNETVGLLGISGLVVYMVRRAYAQDWPFDAA